MKKNRGISDYFSLYKNFVSKVKNNALTNKKRLKIAILSSFTIKGIKEVLFVNCYELGIIPEIYEGNYNQYAQDIYNKDSELYKFRPNLTIIFIDTQTILGEHYLLPYHLTDEQRKKWFSDKIKEIRSLINLIKENSSTKILLHNFEIPFHSPLGILENKQNFGFIKSVELLNIVLNERYKKDNQVFIFDYNSFCSRIGKQNIIDYKMYYLGDIKINLQYLPELCKEYLSYIKPLANLTKKCIVLDLDDTLWGGVLGEEGLEGIKLDQTPEGRPFLEFQKYLLSLFNRGIILAINSKNNYDEVIKAFKEHPHMILKEDNFAAMQINWNDKISNMKSIVEELNIGMDSLVFIDDDEPNREMIKKAFPEVLVIELPKDSSLYVKTLMEINDFNTFQITEEDKIKGKMYVEQRKRKISKNSVTDITEYLEGLEMVVTIENGNLFNIPRISQLTQKTNQFNMTTKRYSEEDIKQFNENPSFIVLCIKVKDKYGDNGITGAAIIEKGKEKWKIDTFLLSCRIIGRRIEETLLAYILGKAKEEKVKLLIGEFIFTGKNIPAKDFYKKSYFQLVSKKGESEIWEIGVEKEYKYPHFIKLET